MVVGEDISEEIQEQRTRILLASENGLFTRTSTKEAANKLREILNVLKDAEESIGSNPAEARHKLDIARCEFDEIVEKAGLGWRVKYLYVIPIFLYLTFSFIVFLLMWYYIDLHYQGDLTVLWIPAWSIIWGGVGSILRGLYWLWYQVNRRHYRKVWILWFLAAPIMGCILGGIMYLIFISGYIAATQSSLTNKNLPMLLSVLAGFSWPWAIGVIKKLTEIFGVKAPSWDGTPFSGK